MNAALASLDQLMLDLRARMRRAEAESGGTVPTTYLQRVVIRLERQRAAFILLTKAVESGGKAVRSIANTTTDPVTHAKCLKALDDMKPGLELLKEV